MEDERELAIPIEERAKIFKDSIFLPLLQGLGIREVVKKLVELWNKDVTDLDIEVLPKLGDTRYNLIDARLNLLISLEKISSKYPNIADEFGITSYLTELATEDEDKEEKELLDLLVENEISPFALRFLSTKGKEDLKDELEQAYDKEDALSSVLSLTLQNLEEEYPVAEPIALDKFLLLLNILRVIPLNEERKPYFPFGINDGFREPGRGGRTIFEDNRKFKKSLLEFYKGKKGEWKGIEYVF